MRNVRFHLSFLTGKYDAACVAKLQAIGQLQGPTLLLDVESPEYLSAVESCAAAPAPPVRKTIFACRYSSHINGTAGTGADDDRAEVYAFDPPTQPDWSAPVDDGWFDGEVWRVELSRFLKLCRGGHPPAVDLLFLPDSAYSMPLPAALLSARQSFITGTTLAQYRGLASAKRDAALSAWDEIGAKKGYHALLFLWSAYSIVTRGRPDFEALDYRTTLQEVRAGCSKERFEDHYRALKEMVEAQKVDLPSTPTIDEIQRIYTEITGLERIGRYREELAPIRLSPARIVHGAAGIAKAIAGHVGRKVARKPAPPFVAERMRICQVCDQYTGSKCRLCGCNSWSKVRNAGESCPLNPPKWGAVPNSGNV